MLDGFLNVKNIKLIFDTYYFSNYYFLNFIAHKNRYSNGVFLIFSKIWQLTLTDGKAKLSKKQWTNSGKDVKIFARMIVCARIGYARKRIYIYV